MKISTQKHTILIFAFSVLLSVQNLYAKNQPPTPKGYGGFDDSYVVGGAIDNLLPYLLIVAILFGLFSIIKKINQMNGVEE